MTCSIFRIGNLGLDNNALSCYMLSYKSERCRYGDLPLRLAVCFGPDLMLISFSKADLRKPGSRDLGTDIFGAVVIVETSYNKGASRWDSGLGFSDSKQSIPVSLMTFGTREADDVCFPQRPRW